MMKNATIVRKDGSARVVQYQTFKGLCASATAAEIKDDLIIRTSPVIICEGKDFITYSVLELMREL